jgi:putative transposase
MRQPRLKVPADCPIGFYHCVSRVVDRRFIFQDAEKEHFIRLLRECEAFCQVQVLTYCLMSNHFHILVAVPQRPSDPSLLPSAEQIIAHLQQLSGHQDVGAVRRELDRYRRTQDADGEARLCARYHVRMWNISFFMQMLKQRFSQWFNARAGRKGTLWEERFTSVVVDGAGEALATMAAYIDLNPVRAHLVQDPKDYRWCGYAEAVAGHASAQRGLQLIIKGLQRGQEEDLTRSLERYRMQLYLKGDESRENRREDGMTERGAFSREQCVAVLKAQGKLSWSEYLRCRVRYFCDGAVYGSQEFVEEMFQRERGRFGPRRKDGARPCKGIEAEMYSLRDLRGNLFG